MPTPWSLEGRFVHDVWLRCYCKDPFDRLLYGRANEHPKLLALWCQASVVAAPPP